MIFAPRAEAQIPTLKNILVCESFNGDPYVRFKLSGKPMISAYSAQVEFDAPRGPRTRETISNLLRTYRDYENTITIANLKGELLVFFELPVDRRLSKGTLSIFRLKDKTSVVKQSVKCQRNYPLRMEF